MAEIALTAALNIIGNLAVEEGNRLYGLSGNIGWIEGKTRQIQAFLKDADSKSVPTAVMTVLNQNIIELGYDMEDVLETFLPQMASYNSPAASAAWNFFRRLICIFCYWSTAHNFALEITEIRTRMERIVQETPFDITAGGAERATWDPRRPRLNGEEPVIIGFDGVIPNLKDRLVNKSEIKLNFISIVGMPGLGKTTLAKNLFKSTRDQFPCSALVYVSRQPNKTDITEDIARQVGLVVEKCDHHNPEANLEANLLEYLRKKRYVIMFDDIWDNQTWDALKVSIPMNSKNGSRIILTSRNSGVGRYIGGESSLHELQPLDPKSSWQLFCQMVVGPVENDTNTPCLPSELEDIGRKIVKRCGGVPLAIVVTAGLLRERERRKDRWSEVLKSMGSHHDVATRSTLALSYKDLPIELKPCFLFFGLFPEDYEVVAFQLINMWVAEKFIKVVGSLSLEEVGEAYLNNLVARNLIQVASRDSDGRIRSCRIHDLLRTLCIEMAKESNFFATLRTLTSLSAETSISAERVRRVTTTCPGGNSDDIEWDHQTPKLRSFLSFGRNDLLTEKQLKNLCRSSKFIRVLSVNIDTRTSSRVSLPNEIGNLIHLSYLEIRSRNYTKSVRFPNTISNLKNLLTLNLQRCNGMDSLPDCFRKMKQLRHILLPRLHDVSLSDTSILEQASRHVALRNFEEISLPNLQTLKGCNLVILKARGFSSLTSLQKLGIDYCTEETVAELSNKMAMLPRLEDLSLSFDRQTTGSATEFDLSSCRKLSKMHLRNRLGKLPNTNKFPPNLTELTLKRTELKQDSMETLGKLSNLKILILGRGSYEGTGMVCAGADFPQLQVLEFNNLYELEELRVEGGGMPRLHRLIIVSCSQLKREMLPDRLQNMIVYGESMIEENLRSVMISLEIAGPKMSETVAARIKATIAGVESVAIKGDNGDHIEVIGDGIDTVGLFKLIRKYVGSANMMSHPATHAPGDAPDSLSDSPLDSPPDSPPIRIPNFIRIPLIRIPNSLPIFSPDSLPVSLPSLVDSPLPDFPHDSPPPSLPPTLPRRKQDSPRFSAGFSAGFFAGFSAGFFAGFSADKNTPLTDNNRGNC